VRDVQTFIALQADEIRLKAGSNRAGERRLTDARLSLEEERPLQPKRQEERNSQTLVGDVVLRRQPLLQIGDGALEDGRAPFASGSRSLVVTAEYTLEAGEGQRGPFTSYFSGVDSQSPFN
jgi:hypothetical protein